MKRAGRTTTVSISLDRKALAALKKLANRAHDGNVSATIAALAVRAMELEAQAAFIEKYRLPPLSDDARSRIDDEWAPRPRAKTSRRRAA